jgi:hypothetical protein
MLMILLIISIAWLTLASLALMLCAVARSADTEMSELPSPGDSLSAKLIRLHDTAA